MKNKNIITIETSLGRIFVTIVKDNQIFSKCIQSPRSIEQEINPLFEELIIEAKLNLIELNLIFVSLGPGSFTGIRIGVSAAKALSMCSGAKVIGFTNFAGIYNQFLINKKKIKIRKAEVIIKGPGNEFFKKIYTENRPGKKIFLTTQKQLFSENINKDIFKIGNFENTFKIKNFFSCMPEEKGYMNLVSKLIKKKSINKYEEPSPIYAKEHYAKKI